MALGRRLSRIAAVGAVLGVLGGTAAAPAVAADPPGSHWSPLSIAAAGDCTFPAKDVPGTPWALQRVLLDQLWQNNTVTGSGVLVAVIDTGVDNQNPQLAGKVQAGPTLLLDKNNNNQPVAGGSTTDTVGHGTKVAGIIAAAHRDGVGFVGLAPGSQILSIRQNDDAGSGNVDTLAQAVVDAVNANAQVINISQDVRGTNGDADFAGSGALKSAIDLAEAHNVVVVAASGNDGQEGATYPAAYPTVLAVGASDRNNERASFSEYGDFVKVAAPGVDMLSTVPGGGQCVDNGTSFAAPYVAGVAALLRGEHKDWTARQIRARIEQTAQRTQRTPDKYLGWGVVDPVKAVTDTDPPTNDPVPDPAVQLAGSPILPQPLGLGETQADRDRRTATYVLGGAVLLVALLFGGFVVLRDHRRQQQG